MRQERWGGAPPLVWAGALCVTLACVLTPPAAAQAEPLGGAGPAARSLVAPGWGQKELGQRRGIAYAVAEVALWALWAERRHHGASLRNAYRDLAWGEARLQGSPRSDPAWGYYETLSKWERSGWFDRNPALGGIQPEQDPATFNGSVWQLAVDRSFPRGTIPDPGSPAYASALAWYAEHAWGEPYLWDWSGNPAALAEFKDLIHGSDRGFSQATAALGAVLANHLLSAVDAFVSARIPGETRMNVEGPGAPITAFVVRWAPPR